MAIIELGIELGTANTAIFMASNGIVLYEPSIVAFCGDNKSKKIRAVGSSALSMLGKTPQKTTIITPIVDGLIVNVDAATLMLKEFIKKITPEKAILFPKFKAILAIPTGLDFTERKHFEDVCFKAGVSEVTMVESIILSAIGIDLPIHTSSGGFIVNIGGGKTEIAALSVGGVVAGLGVNIGGNALDDAIIDYIVGKYNLKIGTNTARKLKHEIGSLFFNDTSNAIVNGVDVRNKALVSQIIYATDIREAIMPFFLRIADSIESVINACPTELASDIYKTGIHLCGGSSQILGVDKMFSERLKLKVFVVENPNYASYTGVGKLLGNKQLLEDILSQN